MTITISAGAIFYALLAAALALALLGKLGAVRWLLVGCCLAGAAYISHLGNGGWLTWALGILAALALLGFVDSLRKG